MSENISAGPAPEATLQRLRNLSRGLLNLHKTLLDIERASYEQAHGRVTSGELLRLLLGHKQFAWLRPISELVAQIDERLDADEAVTVADADALLGQARRLLTPSPKGDEFERNYYAAMQEEPDVVLAHRAVTLLLPKPPEEPSGEKPPEGSPEADR
jgi:hypothetical protein